MIILFLRIHSYPLSSQLFDVFMTVETSTGIADFVQVVSLWKFEWQDSEFIKNVAPKELVSPRAIFLAVNLPKCARNRSKVLILWVKCEELIPIDDCFLFSEIWQAPQKVHGFAYIFLRIFPVI